MTLSDPRTFEQAYDEHSRGAYTAAYRILGDAARSEDVVQEVFLRLWRAPEKYDAARGELGSYVRLMARSRALDVYREGQAAGRAGERLQILAERDEGRVEDRPEAAAARAREGAEVRAALQRLSPSQREALVLAYWGGLTVDQIAQRSQVPLGTAKSRMRLALTRLREEPELARTPSGGPARAARSAQ